MMNYQQTLKYLFESLPMYQRVGGAAYKADLQNARLLDAYFGFEHRNFKSIHVAGTNGKGSVSHMLAAVLQEAGYKTGLYTSPHIFDFRERIKVNGQLVPEEFVVDFIAEHKTKFEEVQPSFFEMTVFMAFSYFAAQKVDMAIIEVGLGGRLDTTNIISPIASVITNIGLDHTRFLGNNLEDIAREKAGIIKKDTPVIIGETQVKISDLFKRKAQDMGSKVYFADKHFKADYALKNIDETVTWHLKNHSGWSEKNYTIDLQGFYQGKNINTVLMTLERLRKMDYVIAGKHISAGLKKTAQKTGLFGRWQIVNANPTVVCDVAHNKEGFVEIVHQLKESSFKQLHMVLGFVNDKTLQPIIQMLPKDAKYYLTAPQIPRALPLNDLAELFRQENIPFRKFDTVAQAYNTAMDSSGKDDLIYIGGSTFVVADFLSWKKKSE